MSKAEERALEKYPKETRDIGGIVIDIGHPQYMRDLYIEGYRQAEKDLDVVSWVKEVSGVKELSRAKEEALKAYPPQSIAANYDTINRRDAFEYGYLKAEKDLELTWEDMMLIHRHIKDAMNSHLYKWHSEMGQMEIYNDVLRRFLKDKGYDDETR